MDAKPDTANVIAPPPLIALGALVIAVLLGWLVPVTTLAVIPGWLRYVVAALLLVIGGGMILQARGAFAAKATPIQPWKPTTALQTGGVFAHVRNPMYFGGTIALLGLALALANDWLVLTTIVTAGVVHFGVVRREERYLEAKFGDDYRSYKASVPRYGWKA